MQLSIIKSRTIVTHIVCIFIGFGIHESIPHHEGHKNHDSAPKKGWFIFSVPQNTIKADIAIEQNNHKLFALVKKTKSLGNKKCLIHHEPISIIKNKPLIIKSRYPLIEYVAHCIKKRDLCSIEPLNKASALKTCKEEIKVIYGSL